MPCLLSNPKRSMQNSLSDRAILLCLTRCTSPGECVPVFPRNPYNPKSETWVVAIRKKAGKFPRGWKQRSCLRATVLPRCKPPPTHPISTPMVKSSNVLKTARTMPHEWGASTLGGHNIKNKKSVSKFSPLETPTARPTLIGHVPHWACFRRGCGV